MLFNEPKLLKSKSAACEGFAAAPVSVLFNEPKLLKFVLPALDWLLNERFSALQRAEIAEMPHPAHQRA